MSRKLNTFEKAIPTWLTLLMATACGLIVANLYYAQPLVGLISRDTGISANASGLIVTMTQIGYVLGLLFIVPLSDLLENRKLIATTLIVAISGLCLASFSKTPPVFFIAAILIGTGSVAAQILVPLAAHLAPEKQRGQMVGNVMSGLLLGIMLARPASSLITAFWGWQTVFLISAILMGLLILVLVRLLPKRKPEPKETYGETLKSLSQLFISKTILRRRALYQACLFGSFSLFWTVVPLWLAKHFQLSQMGIAIFALAGVAGAIAAPIAGRLADKGLSRQLTGIAFITAVSAFALTHIFADHLVVSLGLFGLSAILLDMAVSGNLVLGQQAIYALGDEIRGRVNGVFMAVFFAGGAIGSALGGWSYAQGSWALASIIGLLMPVIGFIYYLTERQSK
ncbi:MAG: MFS transporter [Acetobacterium woodii]|nr:MFS transporter [Acetobacterium woodii]